VSKKANTHPREAKLNSIGDKVNEQCLITKAYGGTQE